MNDNRCSIMVVSRDTRLRDLISNVLRSLKFHPKVVKFKHPVTASAYLDHSAVPTIPNCLDRPALILWVMDSERPSELSDMGLISRRENAQGIPLVALVPRSQYLAMEEVYRQGAYSCVPISEQYSPLVIELSEVLMYWTQTCRLPQMA